MNLIIKICIGCVIFKLSVDIIAKIVNKSRNKKAQKMAETIETEVISTEETNGNDNTSGNDSNTGDDNTAC